MKNLWILNHYAQEPSGAGGTRHFHLAEHLKIHGWATTIIASSIDYQTGKQRLLPGENHKIADINQVSYLWLRTPDYKGNGSGRIKNMLSYTYRALVPNTTKLLAKPDIIIGSSVHPFAAWAGAMLARRYKVPFIFEVRDLWPQTLIDLGRLKEKSATIWILRKLETWLYRESSKIIVLLPKAHEYITPQGIDSENIIFIPNGVDLHLFPEKIHTPSKQSEFTLMYFGAHGQANGLDHLLQAMRLLQGMSNTSSIKLRLIGDGPLKKSLIQLAQKLNLKNISFEEPVPKKHIPILSSEADAFIITVPDRGKLYHYGISPNKLFDYLASQRPIIFSGDTANNPVKDAQAGLTIPPENPQALAQAILELSQMPFETRKQMGINGRRYVEKNHSFDQLAKRLANTLNKALIM